MGENGWMKKDEWKEGWTREDKRKEGWMRERMDDQTTNIRG